jgi:hypothetical protein
MDEWLNKTQYIYSMEYYSAIKKNEISTQHLYPKDYAE